MKKTLILVALAGGAALAIPALAQTEAPASPEAPQVETPAPGAGMGAGMGMGQGMMGDGMGPMGGRGGMFGMLDFATLDADGDGRVTTEELQAFRTSQVEGVDADGNGLVSQAELEAHMSARMAERIGTMAAERIASQDANGDGQLSVEELMMPPMPARMFERLDADGDGAVSQAEFDAAREQMQDRGGRGDGPGRGEGRGHGGRWWNRG